MSVGLQFLSEFRSKNSMVLLGEVTKGVLNSLHKLFLVENNGSLRSVRNVRIQRLTTNNHLQQGLQFRKGIQRDTTSKNTKINRHS